jgi:S-adenosylmethionine:tRNA ribosyltransferase-isomerase
VPPLATDLFDYVLPDRLIAQTPAARRDASRLLVVNRAQRTIAHHVFTDLPQFLRPGDTLIRNNVSVLPARLHARRPTGARVECFLLRPGADPASWHCLLKPGRRLPPEATFADEAGHFTGTVVTKDEDGIALVRFATRNGHPIADVAAAIGEVPLPPYIQRNAAHAERSRDVDRYQTVYADPAKRVAVAAPTAGLHFTPELLQRVAAQGVRAADVTLHVGLGTFRPIATATVEEHVIHRERYELPVATQRMLFPPLTGRRIAVGTTSLRTVEDFLSRESAALDHPYQGEADIFIHPPATFRGADALITNFHQPRSTLLCLVAAFLAPGSTDGIAWLKEIYAEAIAREYRFFSYGDAMFVA